jgi:hypothetical protein
MRSDKGFQDLLAPNRPHVMNFKGQNRFGAVLHDALCRWLRQSALCNQLLTLEAYGCDDGLIGVRRSLMMAAWSYGICLQSAGNRRQEILVAFVTENQLAYII